MLISFYGAKYNLFPASPVSNYHQHLPTRVKFLFLLHHTDVYFLSIPQTQYIKHFCSLLVFSEETHGLPSGSIDCQVVHSVLCPPCPSALLREMVYWCLALISCSLTSTSEPRTHKPLTFIFPRKDLNDGLNGTCRAGMREHVHSVRRTGRVSPYSVCCCIMCH